MTAASPLPTSFQEAVLDAIDECPGLTIEQDRWLTATVRSIAERLAAHPSTPEPLNSNPPEVISERLLTWARHVRRFDAIGSPDYLPARNGLAQDMEEAAAILGRQKVEPLGRWHTTPHDDYATREAHSRAAASQALAGSLPPDGDGESRDSRGDQYILNENGYPVDVIRPYQGGTSDERALAPPDKGAGS